MEGLFWVIGVLVALHYALRGLFWLLSAYGTLDDQ